MPGILDKTGWQWQAPRRRGSSEWSEHHHRQPPRAGDRAGRKAAWGAPLERVLSVNMRVVIEGVSASYINNILKRLYLIAIAKLTLNEFRQRFNHAIRAAVAHRLAVIVAVGNRQGAETRGLAGGDIVA